MLFSFFVSFDDTGIGPELTAASDKNAYDYGVAVAAATSRPEHRVARRGRRRLAARGSIGRRLDNIFHGIADTETTPRLIVAEPYLGGTGYQMFLSEEGSGNSGYQWLHLSTNAVYDYGDNAVDQFDRCWNEPGATDDPVWDSEPPYASATHYCGDPRPAARAQLHDVHPRRLGDQLRRRGLVAVRQARAVRRRARVVRGAGRGDDGGRPTRRGA